MRGIWLKGMSGMGKLVKTIAKTAAIKKAVTMMSISAGAVAVAGKTFVNDYKRKKRKQKGEITMKKSTFVSILVALAAVAGALGAAYLYLVKREQELAEYEQMLFSEDFDDNEDLNCDCGCDCSCGYDCGCEDSAAAPAEAAAPIEEAVSAVEAAVEAPKAD